MALTPTTRLAARYPNLAQAADLAFLLQTIAQDIDLVAARYDEGVTGARPGAGIHGRFYWDTTTSILYYDDGTAWHSVGSIAAGSITLAMMGADSVDSSKIVNGSVAGGDLATNIAVDTTGSVKGNIVESGATRLRVHRTPYGNDRHICTGSAAMSSDVGSGSTGSATFDRAFGGTATVAMGIGKTMNGGHSVSPGSSSVSFLASGGGGAYSMYYIAEGPS